MTRRSHPNIAVLGALAVAAAPVGFQARPDAPTNLSAATVRSRHANLTDLDGLCSLVRDQALRSGPAAPIPAFDSKRLPAWASSPAALASNGRSAARAANAWACVQKAKARPWTYRVPAAVAGRPFDAVPPSATLVEVLNAPNERDVPWVGVTLDGKKLTRTAALP